MLIVRKRKYKSGKEAYFVDFKIRGNRYRRVLNSNNKAMAVKEAQKLFEDALNKKYDLIDKYQEISLRELSDRYLEFAKENKRSWDRDIISLKNILNMEIDNKKLGEYSIEEITSEHILKYQTRRKRELDAKYDLKKISKHQRNYATVNRELACLKHIFYLAMDWEMIHKNPVARKSIRFFPERKRERYLSKEEIARLLSASKGHTYQIVAIALNTGMRLGEILKLKWRDIDLTNKKIYVRQTKTNEDRVVPINKYLLIVFDSIPKDGENLFKDRLGNQLKSIKHPFKRALSEAEIESFRFHDIRHTFSSYLAMNGVDETTRAELLGHKKRSITSCYTHADWESKKKAVEIIGNFCHVFGTQAQTAGKIS